MLGMIMGPVMVFCGIMSIITNPGVTIGYVFAGIMIGVAPLIMGLGYLDMIMKKIDAEVDKAPADRLH